MGQMEALEEERKQFKLLTIQRHLLLFLYFLWLAMLSIIELLVLNSMDKHNIKLRLMDSNEISWFVGSSCLYALEAVSVLHQQCL
ncbi:CLUMA_CG002731, isoform A [Clunio marinus]|uniref:CLUMA_CG002731, isoform A n=1 Tax=Clunio marinus TaxID=568069 RepID=A0A1J1HNH6_9DIPT|nr:CLUMA_CG002731, isoform A [Clunio marinus]